MRAFVLFSCALFFCMALHLSGANAGSCIWYDENTWDERYARGEGHTEGFICTDPLSAHNVTQQSTSFWTSLTVRTTEVLRADALKRCQASCGIEQRAATTYRPGISVTEITPTGNTWKSSAAEYTPGEAYTDIVAAVSGLETDMNCSDRPPLQNFVRKFFNISQTSELRFSLVFSETAPNTLNNPNGIAVPLVDFRRTDNGDCVINTAHVRSAEVLRLISSGDPIHVTAVLHSVATQSALAGVSTRLGGETSLAKAINVGFAIAGSPMSQLIDDRGFGNLQDIEHKVTNRFFLHPSALTAAGTTDIGLRFSVADTSGQLIFNADIFPAGDVSTAGNLSSALSFERAVNLRGMLVPDGTRTEDSIRARVTTFNEWDFRRSSPLTLATYKRICGEIERFSGSLSLSKGATSRLMELARGGETEEFWKRDESEGVCRWDVPAYPESSCWHRTAGNGVDAKEGLEMGVLSAISEMQFEFYSNNESRESPRLQSGDFFVAKPGQRQSAARLERLLELDPRPNRTTCIRSLFPTGEYRRPNAPSGACSAIFINTRPEDPNSNGGWHVLDVFTTKSGRYEAAGDIRLDVDPYTYINPETIEALRQKGCWLPDPP